jgi:hypothetical protein
LPKVKRFLFNIWWFFFMGHQDWILLSCGLEFRFCFL